MQALFQKRRLDFLQLCLKYLRYVLNDHFVLIMMVLVGFLALQYRDLLLHFPANPWPIALVLALLTLLILFAGKVATYLEPADAHFLLTKEAEVKQQIRGATWRAFLVWGGLQVLIQLLLLPLYLQFGWSVVGFVLYLLLLTGLKYGLFHLQVQRFLTANGLDWDGLIAYEKKRKQGVLQFYALFTHVKGISSQVKRRAYLDGLLALVPKQHKTTWTNLYLRGFLRSGDFWPLSVRLTGLSLVLLATIGTSWLAVGLVALLDYLLFFQLLGMYGLFDYQYLTRLYPLPISLKKSGLLKLLQTILGLVVLLEILIGLVFLSDKILLLYLGLFAAFLGGIYLPQKAKKLFD